MMERVAIVGIGGIFPRSPDLERFWANIAGAIDATGEVPPGRWLLDPADVYDARVGAPDRVYATRGGFIEEFQFDPEGLDIDRDLLARLDPAFHLALHAARQAWRDARPDRLDRRRVGVIFRQYRPADRVRFLPQAARVPGTDPRGAGRRARR